jgi:pseudaminic acid cytidylyltransferase
MNIAVIPARGGSKRIPRKNIKLFHGIPIIAYAIKVARESEVFDQVFVSTDDEEIAKVAEGFGAIVPWIRTKDLSDDYATTVSVMKDAVTRLESELIEVENVCCIYPASPLLKPSHLSQALQILNDADWSYVFSGLRTYAHPQRYFSLGNSKEVNMLLPKFEGTRTQDLENFYQDAGQFYWGRQTSWKAGVPIFTSRSTILEIPSDSAIDIDTVADWRYAEDQYAKKIRE